MPDKNKFSLDLPGTSPAAAVSDAPDPVSDETLTPELTSGDKAARKAARKQKKKAEAAARKKAKESRREYEYRSSLTSLHKRPIVCPPDRAMSQKSVILGLALRILVILFTVIGISFFAEDAFAFNADYGISFGFVVLWSTVFTGLLSAAVLLRPVWAKIICALAVPGALVLALLPDIPGAAVGTVPNLIAAISNHVSDVGYFKEEQIVNEAYIAPAVAAFILIAGLIYVPFLLKRVRILVPAIFSAALLWVIFVFNLTRSNWGVALVIASFSALLVMWAYDNIFVRKPDRDQVDTTIRLFGDESAADFVDDTVTDRAAAKNAKAAKAAKKAEKAKKKAIRTGKSADPATVITVDEEISDYFSTKKKPKNAKSKKSLSPEEKKAAAAAKKEEKRRQRSEKLAAAGKKTARDRVLNARAASGGFAGACVFLVAMILLLIPASSVSGRFSTIDVIDKRVDYYRQYVTALLMGDDPTLDILAFEGDAGIFESRSTDATPLRFKNVPVMRVDTNLRQYPVYLRGWIGVDYADGSWYTASPGSEVLAGYRDLFSTDTDPGETMLWNFWRSIDPSSIPEDMNYANNSKINSTYGFAVGKINVTRLDFKSKLLNVPSFSLRSLTQINDKAKSGKTAAFLPAVDSSEPSKFTYANYFDGMFSSYRAGIDSAAYATVSALTMQKNTSAMKNVADAVAAYNLMMYSALGERVDNKTEAKWAPGGTGEPQIFRSYTISYAVPEKKYTKTVYGEPVYQITYWISDHGPESLFYIRIPLNDTVMVEYPVNSRGTVGGASLLEINPEGTEYLPSDRTDVSVTSLPYSIRYYELFDSFQQRILKNSIDHTAAYTDFVYKTYTEKPKSTAVSALLRKIVSEATVEVQREREEIDPATGETYSIYYFDKVPEDFTLASRRNAFTVTVKGEKRTYTLTDAVIDREVYRQRHNLVMEIIDYMADPEHFTYTLSPVQTEVEGLDGVDKFLTVTHEGYCVQYASALTLMLRAAGIPARYVDGYIASGFTNAPRNAKDDDGNPLYHASYTSTVYDRNAHAWVEVWFDGIGWIQYEATPAYYGEMYYVESHTDPTRPIIPTDPTDPGDEGGEGEDLPDDPGEDEATRLERERAERRALIRKIVIICAVCLAAAALITVAVIVIVRRARRAEKHRHDLFAKLADAPNAKADDVPSRDEVREAAELISDLLEECGEAPVAGEFRDEYAVRIASELASALTRQTDAEKGKNGVTSGKMNAIPVMDEAKVARMLDAIASEEFGYGAGTSDLPLFSWFWERVYRYHYKRTVPLLRRFRLWIVSCRM